MADNQESSTEVTKNESNPDPSIQGDQPQSTHTDTSQTVTNDDSQNESKSTSNQDQPPSTAAVVSEQSENESSVKADPDSTSEQQQQSQPMDQPATTTATTSPSSSNPTPLVAEDSQSRDTAVHSRKETNDSIHQTYQPNQNGPQQTRNGPPAPQMANGRPQGLPPPNAQGIRPLQQQQQQQRPQPMIRLRVLSIEKAGRDLIVRMDSMVSRLDKTMRKRHAGDEGVGVRSLAL